MAKLDDLIVNSWNVTRVVVEQGEDEGIGEIAALVVDSTLEEHWAFLPGAGLWVELGLNELATPQATQVEVDIDYLAALLDIFDTVHLYHFHPVGAAELPVPETTTALRDLSPALRASVAAATPGPTDILASFDTAWMLDERPGAELRNFVVSVFGIVEFGPTQSGRRRYGALRGQPLVADDHFDFSVVAGVRQSAFSIERTYAARPDARVVDLIEDLCAQLTSADYQMSFVPFR